MARGASKETEQIIASVQDLVSPNQPTTIRFVLYKLISTGILQSTEQYPKLSRIINNARVQGELDDDAFVDNKRVLHKLGTWKDLTDYKETIRKAYSRDRWFTQNKQPILLVEKGTVGDVVRGVCSKLQVPLFVSSGYFSRSFLCKLADLIIECEKPVQIGYVGDGDPSGFDIERAARKGNGEDGTKRREGIFEILYGKTGEWSVWDDLTWTRLAITDEDLSGFKDFQLVKVKDGDTRSYNFTVEHALAAEREGEFYGAEVEALDQAILLARVREFVEEHTDSDAWGTTEKLETADKEALSNLE
jgi:hypothetical protein